MMNPIDLQRLEDDLESVRRIKGYLGVTSWVDGELDFQKEVLPLMHVLNAVQNDLQAKKSESMSREMIYLLIDDLSRREYLSPKTKQLLEEVKKNKGADSAPISE